MQRTFETARNGILFLAVAAATALAVDSMWGGMRRVAVATPTPILADTLEKTAVSLETARILVIEGIAAGCIDYAAAGPLLYDIADAQTRTETWSRRPAGQQGRKAAAAVLLGTIALGIADDALALATSCDVLKTASWPR